MSDIIHLLPDSVANQIAAGEVIQRPASVVKELVENAVDAGATRIDVVVEDAGRTLIEVIDNGKGMSATDARMAFERHATSKISCATDLFSLRTMGFRGEALASIAAVAQVELKTRTEDSDLGTHIVLEGSRVISQESGYMDVGSRFVVRNIFFNVPARRKFLKSNHTELTHIMQEFERVVLTHPDISFSLKTGDGVVIRFARAQRRGRIEDVFGRKVGEGLLSVEVDTTLVHLSGFVSKPEAARKKGSRQFFFVNNRYMRHPYFHRAVVEAFGGLIPVGDQPSYFLYLDVDPESIDVNIHPQKTEIKFENEPAIWQIIMASVKETLGRQGAVPSIDFDREGAPDIPVFNPLQFNRTGVPSTGIDTSFNPFVGPRQRGSSRVPGGWEDLYDSSMKKSVDVLKKEDSDMFSGGDDAIVDKSPLHYRFKGKYILTTVKSGLMIIHQRRAHIRVLYDRFREELDAGGRRSHGLIFPELIDFSPSEESVFHRIADDVARLGFDVADLGGGNFSINAIPDGTERFSPVSMLRSIISDARAGAGKTGDGVCHLIALSLARSSAVDSEKSLSDDETEALVEDLFLCSDPNHTPDGKLIVVILPGTDIDKMFG